MLGRRLGAVVAEDPAWGQAGRQGQSGQSMRAGGRQGGNLDLGQGDPPPVQMGTLRPERGSGL